jgi:hypothetical protein
MAEGDRNKEWALRSIRAEWMRGAKGPAVFGSALAGGFDEGERALYVSSMLRYPYGPYMVTACERLGAQTFPAAGDAERLRRLANNFQLRQFPTEADERFERRLGLAWDAHEEGGTAIAVRKQLEGYGFPEIYILEECYYGVLPSDAEYHWAYTIVLGPNYGDVPIYGMYLGSFILGDEATGHLGLGSFSAAAIDDIVRIILEWRQVFDCPIRIVFRFADAAVLGLITLGNFFLSGSATAGVAIREIQGRRMLGSWYLGSSTLKGFGVSYAY